MSKTKHIDNEYSISEAYRYLSNAKETLSKSPIEYGIFTDSKYVREAAGIAYLAALKALDAYFISKGMKKAELSQSIDEYREFVRKKIPLNGKLNASMRIVYENLHILAYYRGGVAIGMIKEGFENARKVIEMIGKLMTKAEDTVVNEPVLKYKKRKISRFFSTKKY